MSVLTPALTFRKWETDGVPSSGAHEPKKAEVIQLLEQMQDATGAKYSVATKADLEAITPDTGEQPRGEVLDDATASNNGWYVWDSDTSAWVFERGFPDTFARVTLSGTGTAQTGAVKAGVNPSDIEVFFASVATDNTGAMTLSIGGETARDVVNVAGNALSAGEWTGVVMFFLNDDGDYQLINEAGAAAAAAQSATDAATQKGYAEEWAQSPNPISVTAGGDGSTDYSSKYWSGKAEDFAVALANGIPNSFAANYAAMAQIDPSTAPHAFVELLRQSGQFAWDSSDRSTEVDGGRVIAPGAGNSAGLATDGTDGAWIRIHDGVPRAEWFATGGSGTSSDPWTGFESAINSILDGSGSVYFGPGYFEFASSMTPTKSGVSIYGSGKEVTKLLAGLTLTDPLIDISTGINSVSFLDGMTLTGTGADDGYVGISLAGNSSRHTFVGVNVEKFGTNVQGNSSWVNTFINCNISLCDVGVDLLASCNSWLFLGGAITHTATAALRTDHSEGGVLMGVNIAENALNGISLNAFSRAWTIGPGNYFENNRLTDITCGGSSSNYTERNQGIRIVGNHFAGVLGDYNLDTGVTALTADQAKLLSNIKVSATEGIIIEGNNHVASFLDSRQLAHILLYDPYEPTAKIEKVRIAGNANAIAYRSKVYENNGAFPDVMLLSDYSSEMVGVAGLLGEVQTSSFSTGQSVVFNTVLDSERTYELTVSIATGTNSGDTDMYLIQRVGTSDIAKAISGGITGIGVTITANDQVQVENTSGSNMKIHASLVRRV